MSSTYAGVNTYGTSITIPSDGDVRNASSVNAALQGLADRTTYLNARIGVRRLVTISSAVTIGLLAPGWGSLNAYVTTVASSPGPSLILTTSPLFAGDLVTVHFALSMQMLNSTAPPDYIRVEYRENSTGTNTSPDTASEQVLSTTAAQPTIFPGVSLLSSHSVGTSGPLDIFLNGHVTTAAGSNNAWEVFQGTLLYTVFRAN